MRLEPPISPSFLHRRTQPLGDVHCGAVLHAIVGAHNLKAFHSPRPRSHHRPYRGPYRHARTSKSRRRYCAACIQIRVRASSILALTYSVFSDPWRYRPPASIVSHRLEPFVSARGQSSRSEMVTSAGCVLYPYHRDDPPALILGANSRAKERCTDDQRPADRTSISICKIPWIFLRA